MTELRGEEKVVAATIEATLGQRVLQHDDGSRPGMHDLSTLTTEGEAVAIEVTAAADPESIELWKLVNGQEGRWTAPNLQGGWILQLEPTARAKRLRAELPAFLEELEGEGITDMLSRRNDVTESIESRARSLGIVTGHQSATDFPGSIYFTIERSPERTGGFVDRTGSAVAPWVRSFLLDPHQRDVLSKLERSGARERHAFILVPGLSIAPFGVVDMLWRDEDDVVPAGVPDLPDPVTHVWLMAFWTAGSGLRWSPERGWERFQRHIGNHD